MRPEQGNIFLKFSSGSEPTPSPKKKIINALLDSQGLTAFAKTDPFTYRLTFFKANKFNQLLLIIYSGSIPIGDIKASQPQPKSLQTKFFAPAPPYTLAKNYLPESWPQYERSGAIGLGQSLIIQALLYLVRQSQVEGTIYSNNLPSIKSRLKMRCLNTQKPSFYPSALIPKTSIDGDPCYHCITYFGPEYQTFSTPFSITEALNLGNTLQQSLPLILNHSHKQRVF